MRPASAALALYLAVTAVPLAAGGITPARSVALLAHLGVLALVVGADLSRARGAAGRWAGRFSDLHVLVLLPVLYAELPLLMEGLPGAVAYHDVAVQALEEALFGLQPAWELAGALAWSPLSELLHVAYLLYYPLIYVPPLVLYARVPREGDPDRARDFQETVLALALSVLACFALFVVFPVQGPRYLAAPPGVPGGPFRALALAVLEGGSSRGAAFPSSHVAVAVTQTLLALRLQPRLGRALVPVTLLLAAGAVYGGFHYAVDALAGAAVGAAAAWVAARWTRSLRRGNPGFTPPPRPL